MENFDQSMALLRDAIVAERPQVGLVYYGIATHLIDIHQFYIVPLSCYRLMPLLEKPGELFEQVTEYTVVIYYSPTLLQHVRGIVQKISPNGSCIIFAMDYGVTDAEIIPSNIFTPYHKDADEIPGLAQLCELSMCYPRDGDNFGPAAIESFKFFMGQEREKLLVTIREKNNHKLGVLVVSSESNPDHVSAALAYCNHSVYYPAPL